MKMFQDEDSVPESLSDRDYKVIEYGGKWFAVGWGKSKPVDDEEEGNRVIEHWQRENNS